MDTQDRTRIRQIVYYFWDNIALLDGFWLSVFRLYVLISVDVIVYHLGLNEAFFLDFQQTDTVSG